MYDVYEVFKCRFMGQNYTLQNRCAVVGVFFFSFQGHAANTTVKNHFWALVLQMHAILLNRLEKCWILALDVTRHSAMYHSCSYSKLSRFIVAVGLIA